MSSWRAAAVAMIMVVSLLTVPIAAGSAAPATPATPVGAATPPATTAGVDDTAISTTAGVDDTPTPTPLSTHNELRLTTTLNRTPERVGEITATVTAEIPSQFRELTLQLPAEARLVSTSGFTQTADGNVEWDSNSNPATLTYRIDAAVRSAADQPGAEGTYRFVDTANWSLVRIPSVGDISGRIVGDDPEIIRETEIDGPGVAGDQIAYLGPYDRRTQTAHGQTFHLVVPEAANLEAEPSEIFGSVTAASDRLRIGDRDDEVLMIAAPTGEIEWAVRGIQTGDSDFWVRADESVDTPANNWVHEYVHTRQEYTTAEDARWVTEATATYYAALLTLEGDRIEFDRFQRFLAQGEDDPQASAVMTDPDSWENFANYRKGALVAGDLDRRIRLATDGEASLDTLMRAINSHEGELTAADIAGYIEAIADEAVAEETTAATTATAVDPMWSRDSHTAAFGAEPARFAFRFADDTPISVDGTSRPLPESGENLTVGVNETVSVAVTVENVGGTVGDYELPFRIGDDTTTRTGRLAPGETTTHRFAQRFTEPGSYRIAVGGEELSITVTENTTTDAPIDIPTEIEVPGFGIGGAVIAVMLVGLRYSRRS
ncbi:hypothetical protein [Halonotius roseus]|uniref:CARDB domain-containing protein n=1 Tax=Halonotius roseus TaxID=2511997 RepID=A0A544QMQ3_9EURY|nr:hypothetical protein [Halonotius roseus]TQQ80199.1 hypothetical protein EWF95_06795 [Halonotius roseus]